MTTKAKHTPGPWRVVEDAGPTKTLRVFAGVGTPIAQIMRRNGAANAHLVAAAPELLEAAKAALDSWYTKPSNIERIEPSWVGLCRTALVQAEGRTP